MNLIPEDLGFKSGTIHIQIQNWNELQVYFKECKWRAVEGINGSIHCWRQPYGGWSPLDPKHEGPHPDQASHHYTIRRTATEYSHSHVPDVTRDQVIHALLSGLNKYMSSDSPLVRKELVNAERKRRVTLLADAIEDCRKAEVALAIAKASFKTAKEELDDFRSHFGLTDPDVQVAG